MTRYEVVPVIGSWAHMNHLGAYAWQAKDSQGFLRGRPYATREKCAAAAFQVEEPLKRTHVSQTATR